MARTKSASKKKPLIIVRSLTLTPEIEKLLQMLRQEASDQLGWTVSMSAVARALFRCAEQQPLAWASERSSLSLNRKLPGVRCGERK